MSCTRQFVLNGGFVSTLHTIDQAMGDAKEDKKDDMSDFNVMASVSTLEKKEEQEMTRRSRRVSPVTRAKVIIDSDPITSTTNESRTMTPTTRNSSEVYGSYSAVNDINAPGVIVDPVSTSKLSDAKSTSSDAYSSVAYDRWHHDTASLSSSTTAAVAVATPSVDDVDDGKMDAAKPKQKQKSSSAYGAYGEYDAINISTTTTQPSSAYGSSAYGSTSGYATIDDFPKTAKLAPVITVPEAPSSPAPPRDRVNFSAFSPPSVPPASMFPLYVWAYLPEDRKKVLKEAMKTEAAREVGNKGDVAIARGATISVTLSMPTDSFHIKDDCATKHVLWTGKYTNVFFDVVCSFAHPFITCTSNNDILGCMGVELYRNVWNWQVKDIKRVKHS
jgi:hypothetical protein